MNPEENIVCFKCGQAGHISRECRNQRRTPRGTAPAGAPPEGDAGTKRQPVSGVPPRRPPEEIADAHAAANKIRAADPRFGENHCEDKGDIFESPFRRFQGLGPVHICVLRKRAREQIDFAELNSAAV
jgi:hypothetical protein